MKLIAIRDAFGIALEKLGHENSRVVALEADLGSSTKSNVFGKSFPERYFNVGIAELNMVSMSAGFASCGFIPFVNTFAAFMNTRGLDPIGSLIAYDNRNVKVCGTYCGFSDAYDGASHHALSDMAAVCALPNMTVISVCDAVETEKAVFCAAAHNGPVYLRLSRAPAPIIYDENMTFEIGKGIVLAEGTDVTIVATGYMVHKALAARELLIADGVSARVVDIHTVKPIDRTLISACARETGAIVTVEEHSTHGGLGSAVATVVVEEAPVPMGMLGIDVFAESGDYEQLLTKYHLDAVAVRHKVLETLSKKR